MEKYYTPDISELHVGFIITEVILKEYGIYYQGAFKNTELWFAHLNGKTPYVSLKTRQFNGNAKLNIKNISEFKKLMQQIKL